MKRNLIAVAILLFMLPAVAGAQSLKGSYFLDNSINRHKMNPAFAPRANYLQLPVVSYIGVGYIVILILKVILIIMKCIYWK